MRGKQRLGVLGVALVCAVVTTWLVAADKPQKDRRDDLHKTRNAGNYKDAYEGFRKLALDPQCDHMHVGNDLTSAIDCLNHLGRVEEIDEFREAVVTVHSKNWRLLFQAAQTYMGGEHHGYIVAGKFNRGHKRGGGRYVNSFQRDRTRALQLMQQAMEMTKKETAKEELAQFHLHFANMLLQGSGYYESWRLQYLTDLGQLPDYGEGHYYPYGRRGRWHDGYFHTPAPVDEKGNPVYHQTPKSYADARTDGERWRWMLGQVAEFSPSRASEVDMIFARFLRGQFGPQTMADGGFRPRNEDDDKKDDSGSFALHTLKDDETIARLANGVKRFKLPDEHNYLKVCERVIGRGKGVHGEQARDLIAGEYEDRRQYVKSAEAWKKAIEDYGEGSGGHRRDRLNQIVKNWGRFEPTQTQAAGEAASFDFRFRNGKKVTFEAFPIKVPLLLDDVKTYLRGNPNRVDWQQTNIGDIGHRLVVQGQNKYLGERVAKWEQDLKPRPNHVDDRITVNTPMRLPGAYLVTAQMDDGNISRVIVWVDDTVIVKKQLDNKVLYYVADAATGKPVEKAAVEFFGWRQEHIPNTNQYRVLTKTFSESTDADGQLILDASKVDSNHSWLLTATKGKDGLGGGDRFAHFGFTHVWYGQVHDPEYNQTKVLVVTDRPVYRPGDKVQFKAWVRHAKYDEADTSSFANRDFTVAIRNPKGEEVFKKGFKADEYGGLSGEFPLSPGITLGAYYVNIGDLGGGSIRIEEYKKPEFEVKVNAPKEPVKLGDTIDATIEAKYYFGAPVTSAKVKFKVTRTNYNVNWYPRGDWDWFYGPGYWWFAGDYPWYPGWGEWCGCKRPYPIWWHAPSLPPEIVMEQEVAIGADGIVKVPIDTSPAKALHGDQDHQYTITAEVVDESRRTIVGTGKVLVARKPFKVFSWVDRGHYRVGDTVKSQFRAQTLDGKPVEGKGELTLYEISYDKEKPVEKVVQTWKVDTDVEGNAQQQMKAAKAGQYRLSCKVTDGKKNTIEGGYLFVVRGEGFSGKDFRFNDLELVTDKREYAPEEKVKLLVNTNQNDGTVLLFVRPTSGVYLAPKVIRLQGKSTEQEIAVATKDMPNFFVEALTVHGGRVHTEVREVIVPPEKRVLNVEVQPSKTEYKPGQKATVKVKLTDFFGKPFVGSTVLSVYDKSVEYISGGSNVPEIKDHFWKWRRHHQPRTEASLGRWFNNLLKQNERGMSNLGVFGASVVEELAKGEGGRGEGKKDGTGGGFSGDAKPAAPGGAAPADGKNKDDAFDVFDPTATRKAGRDKAPEKQQGRQNEPGSTPDAVEPAVRKNFADTALWVASLKTDKDGMAEVTLTMPENLTGWKVKVWAMGHGTKVGQGEAEVVTKKDLLVRLQAPRFFVEKDEVVLSANVHNYLKADKDVTASLELEGGTLEFMDQAVRKIKVPAGGEKRVDWRVSVKAEGSAIVRMKAVTDEESDAMQMRFPVFVHGMLKMDSFSGVVRPNKESSSVTFNVPKERRINDSRLEVRYSPTLAGAMVDALPYMVEYPYGCTEQTLNRFLPTVVTQRILQDMKLDLKEIEKARTNLNSQEIGDAKERAKGWKRYPRNPVFDIEEVKKMTDSGVQRLQQMQCADGGWGWFSGFGEHSYPHTTAVVVHGLQIAKANGVTLAPGVVERGIDWLKAHQLEQVRWLKNAPARAHPWKENADNIDALVYMVLADAGHFDNDMRDFLYRDRTKISVYAKAMFGLALHKEQQNEKLAMILKNIEQYVVVDDENQTAYLKLPEGNYWWYWYGSEIEANAYYLKLLSATNPKDEKAAGLVKYLLNNRKHSTYWNSTRDTSLCIEAMADYLKASGEDSPDMTVEIWLDGKKQKEVKIDKGNLFTCDNVFVLFGDAVEDGKHTLEVKRKGKGPVYYNAYVTNFTLEDFITKAGLEVKVNRKYYKLERVDAKTKVPGERGQALDQKVEKYKRTELQNLAELKSGELVEVELEIDSKNDYEYLLFEDFKPAGFEPLLVRSGYNPNDMGAYMELRDERVCFFVRVLARGKHSVSYRMRAEIPGKFSALPARAAAMYAPELKGNSDEIKLKVVD